MVRSIRRWLAAKLGLPPADAKFSPADVAKLRGWSTPPRHVCRENFPSLAGRLDGDGWVCSCGIVYEVAGQHHGSPRLHSKESMDEMRAIEAAWIADPDRADGR